VDYLDNIIEEEVNNKVIPGMTYSIIKDGEVNIGSNGYKALIPQIETITDDTLYDIASLTKVVVGVPLVCKAISDGKMKFNDKVKKYLPDFKYDDVTIYHLLTHTSGLSADCDSKEIVTEDELMNEIYNKDKIYDTGSMVLYSDLGYILLAKIIEKVYGKSIDIIAREELFIPLEMYDTCYNPTDKNRCAPTELTKDRGLVRGVVHDEKCFSMNGVSFHAGVFSTARDLSNYVLMLLNDGVFNGKRILSHEMIEAIFKTQVYDSRCEWNRSFSFIVGNNDIVIEEGDDIISFNGFTGPSISVDRNNNIGIILMTNKVHPSRTNTLLTKERPIISHKIYKHLTYSKAIHNELK